MGGSIDAVLRKVEKSLLGPLGKKVQQAKERVEGLRDALDELERVLFGDSHFESFCGLYPYGASRHLAFKRVKDGVVLGWMSRSGVVDEQIAEFKDLETLRKWAVGLVELTLPPPLEVGAEDEDEDEEDD